MTIKLLENLSILTKDIADFQTKAPPKNDERYYFECIGAHADTPNRNFYQFTGDAVEQMRSDYEAGKTLTVNHAKGQSGFFSAEGGTGVGLGQTTESVVKEKELYIQAYIKKGLTFPQGALGTSDEFIDAIRDGFLNSVSVSVMVNSGICSICNNNYRDYKQCTHMRGAEYIVGEGENKRIETAVVIIKDLTTLELSLVQEGADPKALVTRKAFSLHSDGYISQNQYNAIQDEYKDKSPSNMPDLSLASTDKGDSIMTPEEIKALQDEKTALQKENSTLRIEASTLQTDISAARTENATLQTDKSRLELEKANLEQKVATHEATIQASQQKVSELEKDIADNAQIIADGKQARKVAEEAYLTAYVQAQGNDCSTEDRERQANFAKRLSIDDLNKDALSYQEQAKLRYPTGRQTGEPTDDSNSDNSAGQQKGVPLGVGYTE